MKKKINAASIALFALFFAVIIFSAGFFGAQSASADYSDSYYNRYPYAFYFEKWDVTYDIESNRDIKVCEDLTVTYKGYESTGFIRDIPLNGGELIRDIEVFELVNGAEQTVVYYVYSETADDLSNFICVDIGNSSIKTNETHTYRLKYRYPLTKVQEGANKISLNLIGVGRDSYCDIKSASVKVLVPDGFKDAEFFAGPLYSDQQIEYIRTTESGKTALTVSGIPLGSNEGITASFNFNDGVLTTYFDFTPYIFVILGVLLLIAAFAVKALVFNKNPVTPIVNFEAPDRMDPLIMGKLIDNSVDTEDLTSMIFYWADKGYLKIDLTDENDPSLIRIVQSLPQGTPDYEVTLFNGMFGKNDIVKPSSLKNRFYTTADRVTGMVNSRAKGLYEKKSLTVALLFAVIAGLLLGLAPFIIGITGISLKYKLWAAFIAIIPAVVLNGVCQSIKAGSLKNKNKSLIVLRVVAVILCAVTCAFYTLLLPSFIMGVIPKLLLAAISCAVSILSAFMITRTEEYTEKLNDIVGFKEFIRVAEKDRLEMLIESNPQFYYHVLPYAQVLGVSDKWEEKFADITIPPPYWCTNSYSLFDIYVFNRIMHNSFAHMSQNMYSRPSSSGSGGHGGFGGGHVGGGHGGGGARGR